MRIFNSLNRSKHRFLIFALLAFYMLVSCNKNVRECNCNENYDNESSLVLEDVFDNYIIQVHEDINEPVLIYENNDLYRFSIWSVWDGYKKIYRVEKNNGKTRIIVSEVDGNVVENRIFRKDTSFMNERIFDDFTRILSDSCYWGMSLNSERVGLDGSTWILEAIDPLMENCNSKKHKLVARWSPKKGTFRNICEEFIKLDTTSKYYDVKEKLTNFITNPTELDTVEFVTSLFEYGNMRVYESLDSIKILNIYNTELDGTHDDLNIIDIKFEERSDALSPGRMQIVVNSDLSSFNVIKGEDWEILDTDEKESKYLLSKYTTSKGNGYHRVFKYDGDNLIDINEGSIEFKLKTIDLHDDGIVYSPSSLNVRFVDVNIDGIKDISFSGKVVYTMGMSKDRFWYDTEIDEINGSKTYSIDNPFSVIPIEYNFIYNKEKDRFVAEDSMYFEDNYLEELLYEKIF